VNEFRSGSPCDVPGGTRNRAYDRSGRLADGKLGLGGGDRKLGGLSTRETDHERQQSFITTRGHGSNKGKITGTKPPSQAAAAPIDL
jgi:hypothetical protein